MLFWRRPAFIRFRQLSARGLKLAGQYWRNGWRRMLRGALTVAALLLLIVTGCNLWVILQTRDRLYSDIEQLPPHSVALVLGTSSRTSEGRPNLYFIHRIEAAAALYHAGKIKHIIASGDNHAYSYNEPIAMRRALIAAGVPAEAITLDYAGFRTLDSIVRSKEIFSQEEIVVVSQRFHNERALFIGDYHGIRAIGFNARDVPATLRIRTRLREYLARFKAVLDLYVLDTQPRFLGEKVEVPL